MSIQYINIGSNANDGTGDDLRSAFLKVNDNFQLLATIGGETNIGANLGGGGGQVFAGKTNETLNFRTIAGDVSSGITVNQSGNVITIASNFNVPASIVHLTFTLSPVVNKDTDCKLMTEEREALAESVRVEKGMIDPFW